MNQRIVRFILFFIFFVASGYTSSAQYSYVSGVVLDLATKEPVPYVAIGVVGGYQGTSSNSEGAFSFVFDCEDTCAIKFTALDYFSKTISSTLIIDTIWMKPASKVLKEVVILSKDVSAYSIVRKAIKSIKKNYITKPFVMKAFYRQYCRDSTVYTRLIEAAFDLYQPKGYRRPLYDDTTFRAKLKLRQARRVFNTHDNGFHPPIAVQSTFTDDIVRAKGTVYPIALETSYTSPIIWPINLLKDGYSFTINMITYLDHEEVYEIGFSKLLSQETSKTHSEHSGKLFISSDDYAILRYEYNRTNSYDVFSGYTQVDYKCVGGKYALFRIEKERKYGKNHFDHYQILNTAIQLGRPKDKFEDDITRSAIALIKYDPKFWGNYNVIKRNALEEHIFADLNAHSKARLENAYSNEQALERLTFQEEQKHRSIYDSLIKHNKGILCTVFWRSGKTSEMADEYQKSLENFKKLKEAGVQFVFVSFDHNRNRWKKYIGDHNLSGMYHLRVGVDADKEKYELKYYYGLPVYQIHIKRNRVEKKAPSIYTDEFLAIINKYLDKHSRLFD